MSGPDNTDKTVVIPDDDGSDGGGGEGASRERVTRQSYGRYEADRILGRGAFGIVFLGYDAQLNRRVAIKVPRLTEEGGVLTEQFLAEARQLAQLSHPGIVTVYDVGVEAGACYIVSDYLEGVSLHHWLKAHRPHWTASCVLACAIADALSHAHAHRVVHRDLKPQNVILVEDLKPVLVDFGMAVSEESTGGIERGMVSGTPAFMSPEQACGEGHRIDGRTDIYSLGVILYHMLTGRLPFQTRSISELLRQVREDEPQPPRQLIPGLPRELERICLHAMAKRLEDRYTTAGDMAEDLRVLLASHSGASGSVAYPGPGSAPVPGPLSALDVERLASQPGVPGESLWGATDPTFGSASPESVRPVSVTGASRTESSQRFPTVIRQAREAERRHVTLVHCGSDLFDSEDIIEMLDDEEQQEVLLEYQQLCRESAAASEGTVVQATDDGMLFCFGFPIAFEDAAHRAVRFGLHVLEAMAAFNQRLRQQKDVELAPTVAVHSDVAIVKGGGHDTLSIIGKVLKAVQQLEGVGEPDTVVISGDSHRLVQGYFECESLGMRRLRGVSGESEVFRVLRERDVSSRVDVVAPAELTPLVGRDREVGLLQERWEQAEEGMGQVVLLIGEAGLGKSRLVQVLRSHVREQSTGGVDPVVEWHCAPQHTDSSLHPVIDYFERLLEFGRQDTAAQKLDALVTHLRSVNLDGAEEVALFGSLLSIPLGGRYPELHLSPQQQKERTLELLLDWLRECSYRTPVLFIVEDLHWVDPTALEFIQALVDEGLNDRILSLFTFRPEFETPWASRAHQTQVALNRLTKRQIGEMMVLKSGVKRIPRHVLAQIADRTDGVPLFVEEFTTMVLEAGMLRRSDGELIMSSTFPLHEIPATLQDLLMARLDRMAIDTQVAQLGAAIGREFSYELIAAVCELPDDVLRTELGKLVEAGLLFKRGRGARGRYTFKHALIEDAAYQSLLKRERQEYHRRIAETLERQFTQIRENQPGLLAHHFTEANIADKAAAYWDLAGIRSLDRCAHLEAVRQLTKGLEMLAKLPESVQRNQREIQMQIRLGVPLQSTKGYGAPEVEETYARARELCQKIGDTAQLFPVLYGLFRAYMLQAHYTTAEELGEQLLSLAEKSQTPGVVVAANRALGSTLFYQGEYCRALPHLAKVVGIEATPSLRADAYRHDVVDPWITSRSYTAWTYWLLGFPEKARVASQEAIREAERANHSFSLALALSFASWLEQFALDTEATRATASRALAISEEEGYAFWIGWCRVMLGWVMAEEGKFDEAINEMRQGLVDWRAQGSELGRSYFLVLLAEACARAGRLEDGLSALAEAEEFARSTQEAYWTPEILRVRAQLLLQRDPACHRDAQACLQQALEKARAQDAKSLELRAAMDLARLWHGVGVSAQARELLAGVYSWFTEGTDTHDLKAAQALLGELASHGG